MWQHCLSEALRGHRIYQKTRTRIWMQQYKKPHKMLRKAEADKTNKPVYATPDAPASCRVDHYIFLIILAHFTFIIHFCYVNRKAAHTHTHFRLHSVSDLLCVCVPPKFRGDCVLAGCRKQPWNICNNHKATAIIKTPLGQSHYPRCYGELSTSWLLFRRRWLRRGREFPAGTIGKPRRYFLLTSGNGVAYLQWRASAIAQSGFKIEGSSAMERYMKAVMQPPYRGISAVVLGMTWARAAIFYGSDSGKCCMLELYDIILCRSCWTE